MSEITLSASEIHDLTDYEQATKQLAVLHSRGFVRAFINRSGEVVLERAHYEAVSRGEVQSSAKSANLHHIRRAA